MGARSAAVELTAPCTTTSRDTTTPENRSPPRLLLPPLRPAPLPHPPSPQMSRGSNEARGRDTYGRRRGSRYQPSEDEGSASSYLSEGVVNDTPAPHDDTDNDAVPPRERGGGVAPPPTTPPRGRAACCLRSWSHLGRPTGTMRRGRPFNRSSHHPPPYPPCSRVPSLRPTGRGSPPTSEIASATHSGQVLSRIGCCPTPPERPL